MKLDERVRNICKPASSVKHSGKIVKVIPRSEITKLNSSITTKIAQNKKERRSSFEEARNIVVK